MFADAILPTSERHHFIDYAFTDYYYHHAADVDIYCLRHRCAPRRHRRCFDAAIMTPY